MHALTELLPSLEGLGYLGYWVVFLCALGESIAIVGLFTPGSFAVVFAGALASHGYYDFWDLTLFCIAGAIIGDCISFELGRHGKNMLEGRPRFQKHLARGKIFFEAHGAKSVILGRYIGPLRPFVPFIAGMSHMRRTTFYIANFIGAIGWSISYLALGFIFGTAWRTALMWSTRTGFISVILIISVMLVVYCWKALKRENKLGKAFIQI